MKCSQLGFPLPLRSSYYSPKPLQQYLPGCANLKSYPERSRSGKIGVRWVVKFLYFKKFFEMAIDGKLWQIRVGQQTYSSGIGPRYRLAICGRKMDRTFGRNSCRIKIRGHSTRVLSIPRVPGGHCPHSLPATSDTCKCILFI